MSSLSARRLAKELQMLNRDPPPSIAAWMVDDNTHKLRAQMVGPADSPFHKGTFQLELSIPQRSQPQPQQHPSLRPSFAAGQSHSTLSLTYPIDPPSVHFLTPVLHPNVDERGRICLSLLSLPPKGSWSPAITLAALLLSIHQLLAYPNGQDGLVREVTELFNADRAEWERRARDWTRRFAMQQQDEQKQEQERPQQEEQQQERQRAADESKAEQSEKAEVAAPATAAAEADQADVMMSAAAGESPEASADGGSRKRSRPEEARLSQPTAAGNDTERVEEDAAASSPSSSKRSRDS